MKREDKVAEAVKRMKILDILPDVIEAFEEGDDFSEEGRVYVSEYQNEMFEAVLYYEENYDGLKEEIREFEKEYNALVYHVILDHTEMGSMYTFLYVSDDKDEWSLDTSDLEDGYAYAYAVNGDIREIGSVRIRPAMGGVRRIA